MLPSLLGVTLRSSVQSCARKRESQLATARFIFIGLLGILAAAPLALAIHYVHRVLPQDPERAVQWVGVMFVAILALSVGTYVAIQRRECTASNLGLIVLATVSALLVAVYFYWVSFYVLFPADILIWSESDFVNDILKFRIGYPLYSAQANNESLHYMPGSRLLTYLFAWLVGEETSIPTYRAIQVCYTFLASVVAVFCCRRLVQISAPSSDPHDNRLWWLVCPPFMFLMASNALTNPFVHNMHDDALAQLLSILAYYLLIHYVSSRSTYTLVLMAVLPALGFLVKQSLTIWAVLYAMHLVVFDHPRSIKRVLIFGTIALGGVGGVIYSCYLLWGEHFFYWAFNLGNNGASPLRSFQHLLDAWAHFAIGLLGGLVILRQESSKRLIGLWVIWLTLFLAETYTSGIAWMLNHLGPGSLIAGVWFFAGLVRLWESNEMAVSGQLSGRPWLGSAILLITVALLFSGLGFVRIPIKNFPEDAYRYVADIEEQFKAQPTAEVLLDAGSWIYLKENVIVKDRGIPFGDRGYNGTGDFSGMINRLKEKRYKKILARNLHSPIFLYDHWQFRKPSGIRDALLDNYKVIGSVAPPRKNPHEQIPDIFFDEISILVPKSGS